MPRPMKNEVTEETVATVENENIQTNEATVNASAENNVATEKQARHQNKIYFRGVVRSISQQLDDEDRIQNATVITTPATTLQDGQTSGLVTIFWGDNERAKKRLEGIEVGDHIVVEAVLRTYQTDINNGSFFYGVKADKAVRGGLSGLGEYEADRNEGLFVGTVKSNYSVNHFFMLINLITHTRLEGRDVTAHPTFNIAGPLLATYYRNREKFEPGKRVGGVCEIRQRIDKNGKERNEWKCFVLMYEDEDGEMKPLQVPNFLRRPNPRRRERVRAMARSSAEDDLKNTIRSTDDEEAQEAVASDPSNEKMEEILDKAEETEASEE